MTVLIAPPDKAMVLCFRHASICLFESHRHGHQGGIIASSSSGNAHNFVQYIERMVRSERLANKVAGIKHSCTRSKVNSKNFTLDLVQLYYSENSNIIILPHFPSKLMSRYFICLGKPFEIKNGLRRKHCEQNARFTTHFK